jgi:hypothetical protein
MFGVGEDLEVDEDRRKSISPHFSAPFTQFLGAF